jgi:Fe-S-cluster containining protein
MCGACCRDDSLLVTVTGFDISRLSLILGLGANEILRALDFYVIGKGQEVPEGLQHIPRIRTEKGLAFVALKKMENGDCIFLRDNLCMVHAIRPAVCVSFPFVFDKSSEGLTWGLSARKNICPGLGQGPPVSESDLLSTAAKVLDDLKMFQKAADSWNDNIPAPTALTFIEYVLANPEFGLSKDF